MDNNIVKCHHCQKIFFDIGENTCPFCGKDRYIYPNQDIPDFLKNIFNE